PLVFLDFYAFSNATATSEIYTLSLHDALPIFSTCMQSWGNRALWVSWYADSGNSSSSLSPNFFSQSSRTLRHCSRPPLPRNRPIDRKSTRLNSSHVKISYAVFCLKKKKLQLQY